jgi:hypothetical protein
MSDAMRRGTVHETLIEQLGADHLVLSTDAAGASGQQAITFAGGAHAHLIVVGDVAYISGTEKALAGYLALQPFIADRIGARWISLPSSDGQYEDIAAFVTLPSALELLTPTGAVTELPPSSLNGTSVVGIRGGPPAIYPEERSETVYISRGDDPLPVAATIAHADQDPGGDTFEDALTDWGERVTVSAPPNSLPENRISTLPPAKPATPPLSPPTTGLSPPKTGTWLFKLTMVESTLPAKPGSPFFPATIRDATTSALMITRSCEGGRCFYVIESGLFPPAPQLRPDGRAWQGSSSGTVLFCPAKHVSRFTQHWEADFTDDGRKLWARVTVADTPGCVPGRATAIVQGTWDRDA